MVVKLHFCFFNIHFYSIAAERQLLWNEYICKHYFSYQNIRVVCIRDHAITQIQIELHKNSDMIDMQCLLNKLQIEFESMVSSVQEIAFLLFNVIRQKLLSATAYSHTHIHSNTTPPYVCVY